VASPFSIPGAKLTLVVALAMTMMGFIGVSLSFSALTSNVDELVRPDPSAPAAVAEAGEAFLRAFLSSPLRRAMLVANLLASGLLLIASFMLTSRARSAPWWAAQALWANAVYSLAAGASNVYLVQAYRPQLLELLRAILAAQAAQGDAVPTGGAEGMPLLIVALTIFMHAVFAGLYVLLLRMTRREDVRRFVAREV
jgi:hypothetical protein